MGRHVIVGAGPVGTATAQALVAAGHEVTLVTRSGSGPVGPGITRVAADASDPFALAEATGSADALYNCANPPYHRWPELWPPMATSMLEVAARSGAVLVTMGNLYGYGPVDHPLTGGRPAGGDGHEGPGAGRDVGGGPGRPPRRPGPGHRGPRVGLLRARVVDTSHFGRIVDRLLAGRKVRVLGDPDAPHSWTYVPDVGRTLAVLGTDERAWGRPWHVPSAPALSQRELAVRFCAVAGAPLAVGRGLSRRLADGGRGGVGPDARAEGDPLPVRPAVPPRLVGLHGHLRHRGDAPRRRPWPPSPTRPGPGRCRAAA